MVYLSTVFAVALAATSVNGVPLTKRIAQVIADSTTKWEAACDKAGGGEKCNPVAVTAFGTLLAAPGPCEQQDAADNMIDLAKTLKNDPDMIKFAQLFAQQPRNSPTSQSVPYCQQTPKNSELNGLFQCQFQGDDPKTFVGGAKVGSTGTIPFGMSSPVSPAGSCKANPNGPIKDGSQLTDITSDPGVSGASGASNTSSAKGSSSSSSSKKKASASASSNDKTATATGASSGKGSKSLKGDKSSSDCSDDSTSSRTGHSSKTAAAAAATSAFPVVIKLNNPSKSKASSSASASTSSKAAATSASPVVIKLNNPSKSKVSGSASASTSAAATSASPVVIKLNNPSKSKVSGSASASISAAATSASPVVIKLNNPSKSKVSGSASASTSSPIILLNLGSGSTSAAAASGTASSGGFKLQNGKDAQKLNAKFSKLTTSSSCNEGDQACVNKGFAQCVGGKFQVTQCTASTTCVALPLVNSKGTSIACTTQSDAEARIKASGATGGLTGSGA